MWYCTCTRVAALLKQTIRPFLTGVVNKTCTDDSHTNALLEKHVPEIRVIATILNINRKKEDGPLLCRQTVFSTLPASLNKEQLRAGASHDISM